MTMRFALLLALLLPAIAALAQQYRWVDEQGRTRYSDAPPAASAKSVKKTETKTPSQPEEPAPPFEVQRVLKDFPVTLYTAPSCVEPCEMARAVLNKRGIPFTEVPVVTPETLEQVKTLTGVEAVPVLVVGRSVVNAYEPSRYQSLLDSAGYPKEGAVPARSQRAAEIPAGATPPVAEPLQAEAPGKAGPYDTSGLPSNRREGPGPYDTSGLPSNRSDKPGLYDTSKLPANRSDKPGAYVVPEGKK